jgi:hypothetical protein
MAGGCILVLHLDSYFNRGFGLQNIQLNQFRVNPKRESNMTPQEAKDQAAKNWNEAFDFRALFNGVSVGNIKMIHLKGVIDDAMELYARSKWDEAARAVLMAMNGYIDEGDIPTFKP